MPTQNFQPLFGKKIRVTRLDECGNPPAAGEEDAQVVTDGFISIALASEVESGNEIITRKADGSLCVNERMADAFKRFTVTITFCDVEPCLWSLVSNAEPYLDAEGEANGFTIPEGDIDNKFALELWTGLTGQACEEGVEEASGYLLLPFVNAGTLGDLEINGEDAITFTMNGAFTKGGNAWGTGPYDDVTAEGALPTPLDPDDHLLLTQVTVAPPEVTEGCVPMPDPSVSVLAAEEPELAGV